MTRQCILGVALFIASIGLGGFNLTAQQQSNIVGRVLDIDGRPDPDAIVSITGRSGEYKTATDSDGNFRQKIEPGTYQISTSKEYFESFSRSAINIRAGDSFEVNPFLTFPG